MSDSDSPPPLEDPRAVDGIFGSSEGPTDESADEPSGQGNNTSSPSEATPPRPESSTSEEAPTRPPAKVPSNLPTRPLTGPLASIVTDSIKEVMSSVPATEDGDAEGGDGDGEDGGPSDGAAGAETAVAASSASTAPMVSGEGEVDDYAIDHNGDGDGDGDGDSDGGGEKETIMLPAIKTFAHMVIDKLYADGLDASFVLTYDASNQKLQCALPDGTSQHLLIEGYYNGFTHTAPDKVDDCVNFVGSLMRSKIDGVPGWDEALPRLVCRVRHVSHYSLYAFQCDLKDEVPEQVSHRALTSEPLLALELSYVEDDRVKTVTDAHLASWEMSFDEAMDAVLARLRAASETPFKPMAGAANTFVAQFRDGADCARLAFPDLIRGLDVRGDPVAMVPHPDVLIVTGSDDPDGIYAMFDLIMRMLPAMDRPLCVPVVLRQGSDQWTGWAPPKDTGDDALDRLHVFYRNLYFRYMGSLYKQQKALLDALFDRDKKKIMVASMTMMQNSETGDVITYAVWQMGVKCMLPACVDMIMFSSPETIHQPILGRVAYEKVVDYLGTVKRRRATEPMLVVVTSADFPSPEDLEELCGEEGLVPGMAANTGKVRTTTVNMAEEVSSDSDS